MDIVFLMVQYILLKIASQIIFLFQPLCSSFTTLANNDTASRSKSKGLLNIVIKPFTTRDNTLNSELPYVNDKIRVRFIDFC